MLNQIASAITNLDELTDVFYSGCKTDEKIGIEFEKLAVYRDSMRAVNYEDIARFIMQYKNGKWSGIYTPDNRIIGLKNEYGAISLEPGSQFELSLNPVDTIDEIKTKLEQYNKETAEIADLFGIKWLGYGIQPLSTYRNIKIIPKQRYKYMTQYLPSVAPKPLVMMRETSGIQVGVDYKSEEDAVKKMALALKLSPIISAVYANSPIRNGNLTKYKSYRALSWLYTDNDRCGLVSSKLFRKNTDFTFKDYASILLDVPMIFIERNDTPEKTIPIKNLTFRQFLREGYQSHKAVIEDWELHCSLYFPEVRLKSYLEIRNHDNQRTPLIPSVPAFWKGIMYNPDAMDAVNNILEKFCYVDFEYIRHKTPKCGLDMKIRGHKLSDLAKEFMEISYQSLKSYNEEKHLEPILTLLKEGKTPADVIINKWQGEWNKDLSKLIDFSVLN